MHCRASVKQLSLPIRDTALYKLYYCYSSNEPHALECRMHAEGNADSKCDKMQEKKERTLQPLVASHWGSLRRRVFYQTFSVDKAGSLNIESVKAGIPSGWQLHALECALFLFLNSLM